MLKPIMHKWILMFTLAVFGIIAFPPITSGQQPKNPEGWPKWSGAEGWPKWPDSDWLDKTQKDAAKKLEIVKGINRPGSDIEFLHTKASDLLKRSKQAQDNLHKCERLLNASNALLDAAYGIFSSRKADRTPQDFWGVGVILPGLHIRIQLADTFASWSGEKNPEQYVTLARTLYQQARSAYDIHEYQKAKYLADASGSIVIALESIAHTAPPPTNPNIYK
jgi:hypothetical protein